MNAKKEGEIIEETFYVAVLDKLVTVILSPEVILERLILEICPIRFPFHK